MTDDSCRGAYDFLGLGLWETEPLPTGSSLTCDVGSMTKVVKPVWPSGYVLRSPYALAWYCDHHTPFLDILAPRTVMGVVSLGWPIKGSWIEIGCGLGGLLPTIPRQPKLVAGVDIDKASLEDMHQS